MVSRSETARQLLTPGRYHMQLPPHEEIVMVAGIPPIRATKARYYEDAHFRERVVPPPESKGPEETRPDDWTSFRSRRDRKAPRITATQNRNQ